MKKSMTVYYEVDGALYVNLTNRCNNNCEFCIRKNGDGAYGSDPLWLEREPTEEEALSMLSDVDLSLYRELVFCGYGEPTVRLELCQKIASEVKRVRPEMPIRMNTNGMSDLYFGENTAPKYAGFFDTVSISLNAPNSQKYDEMCHPVYHLSAFDGILSFAKNVKNCVQNTVFTVVGDYLSADDIAACRNIADELGIPLRVRTYIGPEN